MHNEKKPRIKIVGIDYRAKCKERAWEGTAVFRGLTRSKMRVSKETGVLLSVIDSEFANWKPGSKRCKNAIASLGRVPAGESFAVAENLCKLARDAMPIVKAMVPVLQRVYAKREIELYWVASSLYKKAGLWDKAKAAEDEIIFLTGKFLVR